ncbi:hypothetical protein C8R46DRAFT_1064468, partial [Mycena filopes]
MSHPDSNTPSFTPTHPEFQSRPWFNNDTGGPATWGSGNMAPPQGPQGPQFHPASQGPFYFFPPVPSTSAPVIDPRLMPLPNDDDDDLSEPAAIAKSRGLKSAAKVGGVRQVDKGKKRARSPDSDSESDTPATAPPAKRGRPKGSSNFNDADTGKTLDLAAKYKPMGQKGWARVTRRHNKWARKQNRPVRDAKSLESKFKTLVRTKKPTGSGYCPPEVKRAHHIERLITERAGTRQLSDGDDADTASDSDISDGGPSSDDSVEVLAPKKKTAKVHTAVARRAPTPPPRRTSRMNAPELVTQLAKA